MVVQVHAETATDRYPDVRAILREVESASSGIGVLSDGSTPLSSAAYLYARAGYLDDAFRAGTKGGLTRQFFVVAQTLYGDLDGARRVIAAINDAEAKAALLNRVADTFWRMGDTANARVLLQEAGRAASTIRVVARRRVRQQMITQLGNALSDEPPIPLSATPNPQPRRRVESPVAAFPITVDGFRDKRPEAANAVQSQQNGAFLTELYAFAAIGDREGLLKHTAHAVTAFQKTMALATVEHLLIQIGQVAEAETYARKIPEDGSDCSLARAEALSAAALAWARIGETEESDKIFADALKVVSTVGPDLAFGKVMVTAAIATAQSEAGFVATSGLTLELALKLALEVPQRPKPVKGVYSNTYYGARFKGDAYRSILDAAIRIHNLAAARRTAELWANSTGANSTGANSTGNAAHISIVSAWFDAGRKDDALAYARSLNGGKDRVSALLWLARILLDEAGGPQL